MADFNSRRIISLLVLLLAFSTGYTQLPAVLTPTPVLDTIPPEFYTSLKLKLERDNQNIAEPQSNVKTFIKTLHTQRFDYIVKTFNEDRLMGESALNQYLDIIFKNIIQSNPQIPQDASLFVYRSNSPNATSFGEGTIIVSLSLLSRLENDAQVAFVLSHELAHYYRDHTKNAINRFARLNFDKELSKEVKSIRNSQYGRYTRMKELMKGLELSINKHSRTHEFEADSVGLTLFLNSRYADAIAPVRTMEILDSIDRPVFRDQLDLKKYFDFKEYSFKEIWGVYKKSDTWYFKPDNSDTAQTHPSCKRRGLALERQLQNFSNKETKPTSEFESIRLQARIDLIESSYHFKQYGKALFDAMVMTEEFSESAYLHGMIGKCLYQLYIHQKNHELGKVLELPDPRFPENYDRLLTFLHILRLTDLEKIAYYYVTTKKIEYFSNEDFLYAVWLCSRLPVSKLSSLSVEEEYMTRFPNGKYRAEMK